MGKYRVFEVAKEYNTTSKVILDILNRNNIEVKNHMSSVDEGVKKVIARTFEHKADRPVAIKAQEQPKEKPVANKSIPIHQDNRSSKPGPSFVPQKNIGQTAPNNAQNKNRAPERPAFTNTDRSGTINKTPQQQSGSSNRPQNDNRRPNQQGGFNRSTNNDNRGRYENRSAGQGQQRPAQGSAGQTYQQRPQNSSQGYARPQGSQQRPQQSSAGQSYQQRPQNSGQGYARPQGQNTTRPANQHTSNSQNKNFQQRDNRTNASSGQSQGNKGFSTPNARPEFQRDNAQGTRKPQTKGRTDSKPKIQGSYATKGSRPNNYNNHNQSRSIKRNSGFKPPQQVRTVEVAKPTEVEIAESINVKEFADLIKREVSEVIKHLFMLGVMVTINQSIDFDTATLVGSEFGVEVKELPPEEDPTEIAEVEDDPVKRLPRPPVITVMGHVDHGKTSLLDSIRKTHVTAREAGGITQHIGAYQVNYQGKKIVFLDTPGHEAFTAMRARGAKVTDVAILVVAADDGVMPQTIEAINHAKAAKVPIIVAINKMDREGANPDHVKQQLAEYELIPEDWGGETIMVPVSAHKQTGISELLEMILLVAEMQDLKANPELPAHGTIIEAQLDKGRGAVATVLIERGTLRIGDTIIAGTSYGKVRAMINDRGEKVKKAGPSTPVEVLGLNDVPLAGDILDATEERVARAVAEKRIAKRKTEEVQQQGKVSLDDIFQRIQEGELKELNIVVKADVQGTIEALKQSLTNIKNEEVKVVVVHSGVGTINESDVMLASAANALIIGFNVRPDTNARKASEVEKVDIRTYRVIYDALNDVEAAIKGMLAPKFKEVIQGRIEVRQVITISKMMIAGCYVLEGKVTSSSKIRLVRDGIVIHEGEIESLRRFKDDVKEVMAGFECGITLDKYREVKEGDIFEAFTMEEIKL